MDNCCACFDSKEAEQAYRHDQLKAVYLSSHSIQEPARVEHSAVLTRNLSQRKVMAYPTNNNYQSHHLNTRIQELREGNVRLRGELEGRKVLLWQRVDYLQTSSDLLRAKYSQKNAELQGLLGEINRYFA